MKTPHLPRRTVVASAAAGAENHDASEGDFRRRRARAHRAYDEWMPVRLDGTARLGDGTRLFRRFRFGTLAELSVLDSAPTATSSWPVRPPESAIPRAPWRGGSSSAGSVGA